MNVRIYTVQYHYIITITVYHFLPKCCCEPFEQVCVELAARVICTNVWEMALCLWTNKVQQDASQATGILAMKHLPKCGQTDESRLRALPPKGRVTFSGDNVGLQWHRKPHHHQPTPLCSTVTQLHSSVSVCIPLFRSLYSVNLAAPEWSACCLLLSAFSFLFYRSRDLTMFQ